MPDAPEKPRRLLVVLPSWLGDAAMATPTLRLLRDALPGAYIAGLARPAVAALLEGSPLLDELHVERVSGVMGIKRVASRLLPLRFDAALLLTNSFSTALVARMSGIPKRVGYDRDGRGVMLTHRLRAPEWPGSTAIRRRWAPVPAVAYYYGAGLALLTGSPPAWGDLPDAMSMLPAGARLELPLSDSDRESADLVLGRAGVGRGEALCLLNPGANNPEKRWPAERFAALADHLAARHGLRVLVNTGPGEEEVSDEVVAACRGAVPVALGRHGQTLGSLKAMLARARLLVTNDTGPRHLGAAFGTPTVALFGPTDPRWTTLPQGEGEVREVCLAAGRLGPDELADEHPERCRIDLLTLDEVSRAADVLLAGAGPSRAAGEGGIGEEGGPSGRSLDGEG